MRSPGIRRNDSLGGTLRRFVARHGAAGAVVEASRSTHNETLRRLTDLLARAAKPKHIILFGSQARGEASDDSDFDVMVVESEVADRAGEVVRLGRLSRSPDVSVDLLVVSADTFEHWRDTPGNVCFEAASEGRILYETA